MNQNQQRKQQAKGRNARKNKNKKNSRSNRPQIRTPSMRLSQCAISYARAQLDPFSAGLRENLPCIPDDKETTSLKFSTLTRSNVYVGTLRYGYLVLNPTTKGSDNTMGYSTLATYAATTVPSAVGSTVSGLFDTSFPWIGTALPAVRIVGCGVRIRYVGSELNRGGTVTKFCGVDNGVYTGATYNVLVSAPETKIEPVNRQWHTMAFRPKLGASTDFVAAQQGVGNYAPMVFAVTGEPGNQFEVEVIRYFEATSSPLIQVTGVGKSDCDLIGLSVVRDYASAILNSDAGQAVLQGFNSYLKNSAASALSGLALGTTATAIPALGWVR
jgi:hypothetical protein